MSSTDAVAAFCAAACQKDVDGMVGSLAADAELMSPLFGRVVFRGAEDVRVILGAAFGSLTGLRWQEIVGTGSTRVALSQARVGGVTITDAMVVELDDDGRIRKICPHLRPWLGLTMLALMLGPKLIGHPGVVLRALTGPRAPALGP